MLRRNGKDDQGHLYARLFVAEHPGLRKKGYPVDAQAPRPRLHHIPRRCGAGPNQDRGNPLAIDTDRDVIAGFALNEISNHSRARS